MKKLIILLLIIGNCYATPYDECFTKAANQYKVPKEVLIAIASVESKFNANAINYNTNKSYDLGVMQVNSSWFNQLAKTGITSEMLKEPCMNIMVGSWILAQKIHAYGFNWTAIQRYNGSDTQLKYAQKVYAAIKQYYPNLANEKQIVFDTSSESVNKIAETNKPQSHFLFVN